MPSAVGGLKQRAIAFACVASSASPWPGVAPLPAAVNERGVNARRVAAVLAKRAKCRLQRGQRLGGAVVRGKAGVQAVGSLEPCPGETDVQAHRRTANDAVRENMRGAHVGEQADVGLRFGKRRVLRRSVATRNLPCTVSPTPRPIVMPSQIAT